MALGLVLSVLALGSTGNLKGLHSRFNFPAFKLKNYLSKNPINYEAPLNSPKSLKLIHKWIRERNA